MDLLERYVQAVGFWLPNAQKRDIMAELSEDLRSQIEDKETELGRPLTEAEMEAVLRHVGRPVLVANRYLPQRHLIGPLWFPIYELVLKIVVACYVVPSVLVWIGLMIFDPAYRVAHAGGWLGAFGGAWSSFWHSAVFAVGTVTIVFAVLERAQAKSGLLEHWYPGKLRAVRDTARILRSGSAIELIVNVVFCNWWISAMSSPVILDRPEVRVVLAPIWTTFFAGFLLLALVNIVVAGVNLVRPHWTPWRAGVRLATDLIGSLLFCALCRSSIVASISAAGVAPARALDIGNTINRVMAQALPIVVIVGVVVLVVDLLRIARVHAASLGPNGGVAQRGVPTSATR